MDYIVSDQHGGLVRAIRQHFQGVTWQRCQTHFIRNVLDATPKSLKEDVHRAIRGVLDAPDLETARLFLDKTLETYSEKAERAMRILEQGFDNATAVMSIPEKRLRTTNSQERLNEEVRRRERVIRIFPNRDSAYRLLGALLMEIDEKWSNGRKYLDMTDYLEWRKTHAKTSSKVVRLS
ncbi:transposase [Paenibacillus melissococcoides]|uniref:transposase n=2 Tax=Paenibacillus TaxID=44249 RepID=UPI0036F27890